MKKVIVINNQTVSTVGIDDIKIVWSSTKAVFVYGKMGNDMIVMFNKVDLKNLCGLTKYIQLKVTEFDNRYNKLTLRTVIFYFCKLWSRTAQSYRFIDIYLYIVRRYWGENINNYLSICRYSIDICRYLSMFIDIYR